MTKSEIGWRAETILKPEGTRERLFQFVLVPNFTMIAFAMAVEPLRIANRMAGRQAYRWSLVSLDGGLFAPPAGSQIMYAPCGSVVISIPSAPPGSSEADRTTAPAPSPNRMHVLRSV